MMRYLPIVVVAACGGTSDGALLTVHAPDGPATAARVEIVLASADPSSISDVSNQRKAPTDFFTSEPVRYYRQRAIATGIGPIDPMDGFAVRIEPNSAMVPDDTLVPFLIAFDDNSTIVGIGAVLDDHGKPLEVQILPNELLSYDVTMVAMRETAGTAGIGNGEVMRVQCTGFESGLAWEPGSTPAPASSTSIATVPKRSTRIATTCARSFIAVPSSGATGSTTTATPVASKWWIAPPPPRPTAAPRPA
jgi:hypothetical protein